MAYLAVVGGGRRRDRQGGGRARRGWEANLDDWLDFLPDSVAQACFSLAPEPPSAPSAPGSACDRRAQKRAEPAEFGVLGARLGVFSAPAHKKSPGGLLGVQLEML